LLLTPVLAAEMVGILRLTIETRLDGASALATAAHRLDPKDAGVASVVYA